MWKDYELPSFVMLDGKKIEINTDWRNIIDIFECMNDKGLTKSEIVDCCLYMFYKNYDLISNTQKAFEWLCVFINGNKKETASNPLLKQTNIKLVDWSKDLSIIIPPVNKILGYDIREKELLHWWTFLGAFYEIKECTFQTYVGIRHKLATRKKLEDWEKEIYREHKAEIEIKEDNDEYESFDDEDILVKLSKSKNIFLND